MRKKILVIPPQPGTGKIKIRLIEIANVLAQQHEVYLLYWNTASYYKLFNRIMASIKDLFKSFSIYKSGNLNILSVPTLHRPLFLLKYFNRYFLEKIIKKEKFDIVINGSYYLFQTGRKKDFKYVIDLADLPVSGNNNYFDKFIEKTLKGEMEKADTITVVSSGLKNYMKNNYCAETIVINNGTNLNNIRNCTQASVDGIRTKYGLSGKWLIGYIGYIGEWVNLDLIVKSFRQIKENIPEAVLLFVGGAPDLNGLRKKYSSEEVLLLGGVSEIEPYFKLIDIGTVPTKKSLFQDIAFHLKVIEYTAARKFIVSAKLTETEKLGFPNIFFAEDNIASWVKALLEAKNSLWNPEWNNLADPYDWENIVSQFCEAAKISG